MQQGLVPKRPSAPPQGGHDRAGLHVDEMQRDQSLGHGQLREVADAAQVVGLRQRHDAAAVLARAGDGHLDRLQADHLPVATLAVQRQHGAEVGHDAGRRVGHQPALQHRVHIARHHAHAMRVVAAQVGQHQVGGHGLGLRGAAACSLQDALDPGLQRRGVKTVFHGGSYITAPSCQGTNSFWP